MITNELINQAKQMALEELDRANEKYPLFSSEAEAYAVIKEEMEETDHELISAKLFFKNFWGGIRTNDERMKKDNLGWLEQSLLQLMAEAAQTLAMVYKAKQIEEPVNKKVLYLNFCAQLDMMMEKNHAANPKAILKELLEDEDEEDD